MNNNKKVFNRHGWGLLAFCLLWEIRQKQTHKKIRIINVVNAIKETNKALPQI